MHTRFWSNSFRLFTFIFQLFISFFRFRDRLLFRGFVFISIFIPRRQLFTNRLHSPILHLFLIWLFVNNQKLFGDFVARFVHFFDAARSGWNEIRWICGRTTANVLVDDFWVDASMRIFTGIQSTHTTFENQSCGGELWNSVFVAPTNVRLNIIELDYSNGDFGLTVAFVFESNFSSRATTFVIHTNRFRLALSVCYTTRTNRQILPDATSIVKNLVRTTLNYSININFRERQIFSCFLLWILFLFDIGDEFLFFAIFCFRFFDVSFGKTKNTSIAFLNWSDWRTLTCIFPTDRRLRTLFDIEAFTAKQSRPEIFF